MTVTPEEEGERLAINFPRTIRRADRIESSMYYACTTLPMGKVQNLHFPSKIILNFYNFYNFETFDIDAESFAGAGVVRQRRFTAVAQRNL